MKINLTKPFQEDTTPNMQTAIKAASEASSQSPTPEQLAAIQAIGSLSENLIIQAVAGSGKSWTLIKAIHHMVFELGIDPGSLAIMVFNKSIKEELRYKLNAAGMSQVTVNTRHGYGLEAIRLLNPRINVNPNKTRDIAKTVVQYYSAPFTAIASITKLVNLAKDQGIGWNEDINSRSAWYSLIKKQDVEIEDENYTIDDLIRHSIEVLTKSNLDLQSCDFPDMVYLPLLKNLRLPRQYRWLGVDEAQDTNVTGRGLAKALLHIDGYLTAVGDDWQAIYGFAGADNDSLSLIKHEFSARELWLSVCFRCSREVIKHAQLWMPKIQPAPDAPEGSVTSLDYQKFLQVTPDNKSAILCRKNAPLMSLAFSYLRRGIACRIEGRDIGQNLIKLCRKWKLNSLSALSNRLEEYREKEVQKFMANGQEQQADTLNDQLDCLQALIDRSRETDATIDGLIRLIEGMFTDSTTGQPQTTLTLSSVHKAKGREWHTVYLLGRDSLMPSKFARQDWQKEQELHLIYVAITRAKLHLIEITNIEQK